MAGFIFDFNGTLFADADKQEISWRRFARDYANKELSDQEFDDHVHGQNAELTLNYCLIVSLRERKLTIIVSVRKRSTGIYVRQTLTGFICYKEHRNFLMSCAGQTCQ